MAEDDRAARGPALTDVPVPRYPDANLGTQRSGPASILDVAQAGLDVAMAVPMWLVVGVAALLLEATRRFKRRA